MVIRKSASGRTLLALEYDRNGNKVRQTDVTGKVTGFEYDRQGQLLRLTDDGQELAAYTYNPDGTPRAVTHGPIRQEYTYDLDKNLTGLTVRSGDGLLSQDSYAYDGNGNRIRKQALEGTTLYQYDALNQLQRVDYPAYSEELFYDKAGNRSRRVLDGEEELYQYDPRNRLMAYTKNGATTPFQYDNAGNLLQDDKAKYTYDAFNRTVKVETFDGNVQVNRYDAEGLRHEMEENGRLVRFIFHKGEAVAEQEENGNVIRLIRGSELIARSSDSESARTYYHYASDEMGSTTHIVDENGNVQNRYAYDAWGRIMVREEAVPNRFTYYGQQIDPITQQYYLRARFYNPVLGRFTQEDTYRGDGLNLYAYCANNPLLYIDPSGHTQVLPSPKEFAQSFFLDFGQPLSRNDAEMIADMIGEDYLAGKLSCYSWNGRDIISKGYAKDHIAVDIFINRGTGQMLYGVSGTVNNPTRYPGYSQGLHQDILDAYDPQKNSAMELLLALDPKIQERLAFTRGNCAEASTESLLKALGIERDGWEHITRKVNKKIGVANHPMCDYCKAALLRGEELEAFLDAKIEEISKTYRTDRSDYNPKAGC